MRGRGEWRHWCLARTHPGYVNKDTDTSGHEFDKSVEGFIYFLRETATLPKEIPNLRQATKCSVNIIFSGHNYYTGHFDPIYRIHSSRSFNNHSLLTIQMGLIKVRLQF